MWQPVSRWYLFDSRSADSSSVAASGSSSSSNTHVASRSFIADTTLTHNFDNSASDVAAVASFAVAGGGKNARIEHMIACVVQSSTLQQVQARASNRRISTHGSKYQLAARLLQAVLG